MAAVSVKSFIPLAVDFKGVRYKQVIFVVIFNALIILSRCSSAILFL